MINLSLLWMEYDPGIDIFFFFSRIFWETWLKRRELRSSLCLLSSNRYFLRFFEIVPS